MRRRTRRYGGHPVKFGRCGVWSVGRAGATSRLRAATVSDPHDIVMVERSVFGIDDGDAGDGAVRRSSRAKRPAPFRGSVAGSPPPAYPGPPRKSLRRRSPALPAFLWTLVQGNTRTFKNTLPFPVHVPGVLDQNRPGRAFLRPTLPGNVPSVSRDYGMKRTGPPDHRTSLLEVVTSSSSVRSAGADLG